MPNFDIFSLLKQSTIMDRADVRYLNDIMLDKSGLVKPVESKVLESIPHLHLMQWCVENAVYQICTVELIEWLKAQIDGRTAIEIGSGRGGIGRALGIKCTDSYMQTIPAITEYYRALGQAPIFPPGFVEKIDANEAVNKYKPEVVIGCYITHRYVGGDDGNEFGPVEENIIDRATYIHVGNLNVHKAKTILGVRPPKEFRFPWLRSRARDQSLNMIWVWEHGN